MLLSFKAYFEKRIPVRKLCQAKGASQMEFYLGDISKVEEVMDLRRCGQEALYHSVVHI